jgi:hypothetical protein
MGARKNDEVFLADVGYVSLIAYMPGNWLKLSIIVFSPSYEARVGLFYYCVFSELCKAVR